MRRRSRQNIREMLDVLCGIFAARVDMERRHGICHDVGHLRQVLAARKSKIQHRRDARNHLLRIPARHAHILKRLGGFRRGELRRRAHLSRLPRERVHGDRRFRRAHIRCGNRLDCRHLLFKVFVRLDRIIDSKTDASRARHLHASPHHHAARNARYCAARFARQPRKSAVLTDVDRDRVNLSRDAVQHAANAADFARGVVAHANRRRIVAADAGQAIFQPIRPARQLVDRRTRAMHVALQVIQPAACTLCRALDAVEAFLRPLRPARQLVLEPQNGGQYIIAHRRANPLPAASTFSSSMRRFSSNAIAS